MDTPDEIARDEWYIDLVERVSHEAIDQFTFERMRSYYTSHPDIAVPVLAVYKEAKALLAVSPSAATVLFITAIELGLKAALLKPVIYGLVHNDSVADLVSELALKQNGLGSFTPLLARLLAEYAKIDFNVFRIESHTKTLREELTYVQKARNSFVHRGEPVSPETAQLSFEVANMIIGNFLASILAGLDLKLVKGGLIADT